MFEQSSNKLSKTSQSLPWPPDTAIRDAWPAVKPTRRTVDHVLHNEMEEKLPMSLAYQMAQTGTVYCIVILELEVE
jgi:hypothetical protein